MTATSQPSDIVFSVSHDGGGHADTDLYTVHGIRSSDIITVAANESLGLYSKLAGTQAITGAKTFSGGVTLTTVGMTITDVDVALSATTGTKIGTATTQKLGFWNATPIVRGTAFTQTDSTATHTHSAVTATSVVTTGVTNSSPYGFVGATQGDNLSLAVNALIVDLRNVKSVLNGVIDDLQAVGLTS